MTRHERRQEERDREQLLRVQRSVLEADLTQIAALIDESSAWAERRAAVRELGRALDHCTDEDADVARSAWYTAAYQDAQQALVLSQTLEQRYNEVARALAACQQELLQLPCDHRRG